MSATYHERGEYRKPQITAETNNREPYFIYDAYARHRCHIGTLSVT